MVSSQSLVPLGGTGGERQQTVAAMQQAGLPLAPTEGTPQPTAPAAPGGDQPRPARPDFDPLMEMTPPPTVEPMAQAPMPQSRGDVFTDVAARSANPFMLGVAQRLKARESRGR